MKKLISTLCAVLGSLALLNATANAFTITPAYMGNVGGVFSYQADHTSGELRGGAAGTDGFTIYDFAGYVAGSAVPAGGWAFDGVTATGSNYGSPLAPLSTFDDPLIPNLNFVYTGADVQNLSLVTFMGFMATSSFSALGVDDWSSRDHLLGTLGDPNDGGTAPVAQGQIVVPFGVPEGGATVALLGLALAGIGAVRRKLVA